MAVKGEVVTMHHDLIHRIHEAQTVVSESAIADDLRRKGLLPPKAALVGTLDDVEALIRRVRANTGATRAANDAVDI